MTNTKENYTGRQMPLLHRNRRNIKLDSELKKNAALKGRILSWWIAELSIQKLFVVMTNLKVEELTAGLYLPVPA